MMNPASLMAETVFCGVKAAGWKLQRNCLMGQSVCKYMGITRSDGRVSFLMVKKYGEVIPRRFGQKKGGLALILRFLVTNLVGIHFASRVWAWITARSPWLFLDSARARESGLPIKEIDTVELNMVFQSTHCR